MTTPDDSPAVLTHRPLERDDAARVTEAETAAFRALVASLDDVDWQRDTASAGWRVREVVAHVGGQYEEFARVGTLLRRLWVARRRYRDRIVLDGHNQVQLDDTADRSNAQVAAQLDVFAAAGIRAVRRMPAPVRRAPVRLFFPEPPLPEKGMRYVFDILAARDTWMHRLEVARATDREFVVGDHDHEIVAQVVRDLDRQWPGPAVTLALDGPAGGTWQVGSGPSAGIVRADAVEMMLHLSGRAGLDLPPDSPFGNARVVF